MRLGAQALPVGRVVASRLGAQVAGLPVGQRLAQPALGLVAAALAVERLQPVLQRRRRLVVEGAQKLRLPAVPGAGPDAADVADGQQRQQVQPLAGPHRLGEVADRARIAQVALLGHVRHQQVIAHQPLHRFGIGAVHPHPRADLACDAGAQDGVILVPALADVVEQQRDIENPPRQALSGDAGGGGQFVGKLAAFDAGQGDDALDGVFVHRVVMVHVELHHRHDRLEFRNEGREHPKLVHPSERAARIAVLEKQVEEDADGLRVAPDLVVDQVQVGGDQAHGVGMEQRADPERLVEDADQVQPVRECGSGVGEGQPVLLDRVAGTGAAAAAEQPGERRGLLLVVGLQGAEQDPRQLPHAGGMAEIVLHEMLDRAAALAVRVAHPLRHFDLQIEGQLVHGAPGR
ncbi:hypothetical protein PARU111607_15995 [Palleronia rufa]